MYELERFNFNLPEELIAHLPVEERASSRLLISQSHGEIIHSKFENVASFLPPRCLLVFNETRVIPARIPVSLAQSAKGEVLLLEKLDASGSKWKALGKPQTKLIKHGRCRTLKTSTELTIHAPDSGGAFFTVEIPIDDEITIEGFLRANGEIPLPPYIKRQPLSQSDDFKVKQFDQDRYQTVYAKQGYSAAAPTAGLHFTPAIFQSLVDAGHQLAFVNLQVGAGTFLPVTSEDIRQHKMHEEQYCLSQRTYLAIEKAYKESRPIVCVGTTTLRCIESFYLAMKDLSEEKREEEADKTHRTSLFIYPSSVEKLYSPVRMSGLITNFHQPKSTLLMLIMALFGEERVFQIYSQAIEKKYRFFSYGDASLIWREKISL